MAFGLKETIPTVKVFLAVLVSGFLLSCQPKTTSSRLNAGQPGYELVAGWPELNKDHKLGQPTGIGIDKDEHIFVFHRAARRWTKPFPDTTWPCNDVAGHLKYGRFAV